MRRDKYAILFFLLHRTADSRPSNCNLVECPSPPHCCNSGQYTSDNRLCCMTCARQGQEPCGGVEGAKCARGLQCFKTCGGCKTIGPKSQPCIFPFKYSGTTYNNCTTRDSDVGHPWCATKVDEDDNHVIDNQWGDCSDGCLGIGKFIKRQNKHKHYIDKDVPCDEEYFKAKEGICIDLRTPDSVPNGGVGPQDQLMKPTEDLFPAPICNGKEDDKRQSDILCNCDRSSTAVEIDKRDRQRGNCTGIAFHASKRKTEFWCFLENIDDPLNPQLRCYNDAKWSYKDGRFWSYEACPKPVHDVQDEKLNSSDNSRFGSLQNLIYDSKKKNNRRHKNKKRTKNIEKDCDEKEKILHISSNGKSCIFPFIYDEKLYSECTKVDSDTGIPWCATGIDRDGIVIDNDWGDCMDRGEGLQMGLKTLIVAEEINTGMLRPTTDVKKDIKYEKDIKEQKFKGLQISSNGKPCIFPFIYDGESYAGCTIKDSDNRTPWCATEIDIDGIVIDNDWGDCLEQSFKDVIETDFPKQPSEPNQTSDKDEPNIENVNYNKLLTEESPDIQKQNNTGLNRESASETLSNKKNNETYGVVSEELKTQDTRDSKQGTDSKTNTEGEQLTNKEIKEKHGKHFESRFTNETNSEETLKTIISSSDKQCVFPFKYAGESYTTCTDKDSITGTPWCATGVDTDGYVDADDWAECAETYQAEQEEITQSSSWFAWLG